MVGQQEDQPRVEGAALRVAQIPMRVDDRVVDIVGARRFNVRRSAPVVMSAIAISFSRCPSPAVSPRRSRPHRSGASGPRYSGPAGSGRSCPAGRRSAGGPAPRGNADAGHPGRQGTELEVALGEGQQGEIRPSGRPARGCRSPSSGASIIARPGPGPRSQSVSPSGVSSGEPGWRVGTDSRPLLIRARANGKSRASARVASRKAREAGTSA